MDKLDVFYHINICLAITLLILTSYLTIYKATSSLKIFKWMLYNIQISAFIESVYWCGLMSPRPITFPYVHCISTGILWQFFKMPLSTQWGISTFLHGLICGGLAVALNYRYALILPLAEISYFSKLMKNGHISTDVMLYVASAGICTPLSAWGWRNQQDTKKILLNYNSTYFVPESSQTFDDYWSKFWGMGMAGLGTFGVISGSVVIFHTNYILKKSTISNITKTMHKEAIRTLIAQAVLMWGGCIVPATMLGIGLIIGPEKLPQGYIDVVATLGLVWFSAKSINCSVAILTTVSVYRNTILQALRLRNVAEGVVAIQSQSSGSRH